MCIRDRREGALEGGQRILGMRARRATMADHGGSADLEEGVRHAPTLPYRSMSALTRDVILSELEQGRLRLDPLYLSQVGVASIDLTLGEELREIVNDASAIRVEDETDYRDHVTSAFVQPGVSNRQVYEMSNVSSRALEVVAGVRICQLVLMGTAGVATYRGRSQHQREI